MSKDSYNYGYGAGGTPKKNTSGGGSGGGKKEGDWGSWVAIVLLFGLRIWRIALPWLMLKLFGGEKKQPQTSFPPLHTETATKGGAVKNSPTKQNEKRTATAKNVAKKMAKKPSLKSSTALLLLFFGAFLGISGATGLLELTTNDSEIVVISMLSYLAALVGGGGMVFTGFRMRRQLRRLPKYLAVLGDRPAMAIDEMARKLGYGERRVEKDLECMMDKGFFGTGAYINRELGYFIRSSQAEAELARKSTAPESQTAETPKEAEEGYSGILRDIRRANDSIADPVLSEKIAQLESIAAKIFRAVEGDPKKLRRIDTFLNYYLPTTQKLLDSYVEFESAGVEGENLSQAKVRIEATMDSIVAGFAHQLDELYRSDAMDVDSDIRVMETMLHRDTASVEKDFGLGGGTATQTRDE